MSNFESSDYVKVECVHAETGESELMWVCVQDSDDNVGMIYGRLEDDPVVNTNLRRGQELSISHHLVREHRKSKPSDQSEN